MPDRARVSVVIPVDNAERYVEASVRCVLARAPYVALPPRTASRATRVSVVMLAHNTERYIAAAVR
jgi:hypothetical protein